jgi:hypothetical protein
MNAPTPGGGSVTGFIDAALADLTRPAGGMAAPLRAIIAAVVGVAIGLGSWLAIGPAPDWWWAGTVDEVYAATAGLIGSLGAWLITPPRRSVTERLAQRFPGVPGSTIDAAVLPALTELRGLETVTAQVIEPDMRAASERVARLARALIAGYATDADTASATGPDVARLIGAGRHMLSVFVDREARARGDAGFGAFRATVTEELSRLENALAHKRTQDLQDTAAEIERLLS